MLAATDSLFSTVGIEYTIFGGTLLGCMRFGHIMPWDDDADITISNTDINRTLTFTKLFDEMGFKVAKHGLGIKMYSHDAMRVVDPDNGKDYGWGWPFLDMWGYSEAGSSIRYPRQFLKKYSFQKNLFFPPVRAWMEGLRLMVPNNPEGVLNTHFGTLPSSYWKTVCMTHFWDHKIERKVKQYFRPCKDLEPFYPFQEKMDLLYLDIPLIPKIIHHVWLEDGEPPQDIMSTCKDIHPTWEYMIWKKENIEELLAHKDHFSVYQSWESSVQAQTHLVGLEILQQFGGVIVDAYQYCLKPMDEIAGQKTYIFMGYNDSASNSYGTNVIGSMKGHFLVQLLLNQIYRRSSEHNLPSEMGPDYFTKILTPYSQYLKAFPWYYFSEEYNSIGADDTNKMRREKPNSFSVVYFR